MDPGKVHAMEEWPRPTDRTQLRRFLGFANFYRRFIRGFSRVPAPLSALTSSVVSFVWSPEAEEAFQTLKKLFVTAPVLIFPDPNRQFIVEVVRHGHRSRPVPKVGGGPASPPSCILVPTVQPLQLHTDLLTGV